MAILFWVISSIMSLSQVMSIWLARVQNQQMHQKSFNSKFVQNGIKFWAPVKMCHSLFGIKSMFQHINASGLTRTWTITFTRSWICVGLCGVITGGSRSLGDSSKKWVSRSPHVPILAEMEHGAQDEVESWHIVAMTTTVPVLRFLVKPGKYC